MTEKAPPRQTQRDDEVNAPSHNNHFDLHSPFWQEWLGNALYFPLLNWLLEAVISDPVYALLSPAGLGLLGASLLQAGALVRWPERRTFGYLIGPGVFTGIGLALYGTAFLSVPNHVAYWVFNLVLGLLPPYQTVSNLFRALAHGLLAASMYYLLHLRLDPTTLPRIPDFLADPAHRFVALALFLLGVLSSGRTLMPASDEETAKTQPTRKRQALPPRLEEKSLPTVKREERVILVMNLRGLSEWSETRQPEETISLLHRYYQTAQNTLEQHGALAIQTRGGEVLAFFGNVEEALSAALKLRLQIGALLHRQGIGVGLGLHTGKILWGNVPGQGELRPDEVGEAIDTARGIEAAAAPGELLASETARLAIGATFRAGPKRSLPLPGREQMVIVYPME